MEEGARGELSGVFGETKSDWKACHPGLLRYRTPPRQRSLRAAGGVLSERRSFQLVSNQTVERFVPAPGDAAFSLLRPQSRICQLLETG